MDLTTSIFTNSGTNFVRNTNLSSEKATQAKASSPQAISLADAVSLCMKLDVKHVLPQKSELPSQRAQVKGLEADR